MHTRGQGRNAAPRPAGSILSGHPEGEAGLPAKDAAIVLSVTALIVALIVLFLVTAPTMAREPLDGPASSVDPNSHMPTPAPQEIDHASRD